MSDGILGRCSDSNPCSWPAIRWEMYGTEKKIPTPSSAPPKIIIYVQNLSMGSGGGGDVGRFNAQILVAPRN